MANRPATPLLPEMLQPETLVRVCKRSSSPHQHADPSRNHEGRGSAHLRDLLRLLLQLYVEAVLQVRLQPCTGADPRPYQQGLMVVTFDAA